MTLRRCEFCGKQFQKLNEQKRCEPCEKEFTFVSNKVMKRFESVFKNLADR